MPPRHAPILLRLLGTALPYKWWVLLTLAVTASSSIFMVAQPQLLKYAVDSGYNIVQVGSGKADVAAQGNMATLLVAVALLLVVAVARGAAAYGQTYLGEKISQSIAYDFRNMIFDRLQRLSYAYHDNSQVGQIMSRATQDVEAVRMYVSMGVVRLIYVLVLLGVSATLMIQSGFVSMKMRPLWLKQQQLQGELGNVLQENLTGMRVVKAFSREEHEQEKFRVRAEQLFRNSYRTGVIEGINNPLLNGLWLLSAGLVFWAGAREISAGAMTPGDLVAFQIYLALLQQPTRMLGFIVNMFARAHAAGTRIYEILDAESAVQEKPGAPSMRAERGEVVFDHVSFAYNAFASVLKDVSIHAAPGDVVALLGPTGSGKSTVVNLLPRFYDVTAGAIMIDGQDVRDVTLESLRRAIGIVQQDLFLFPATLADNIRYGKPDATLEEVIEASRLARMHEYIDSLPDKYDTWVGERGVTLSGGQRQRIAIARTILLDPKVLIFDDSTSSVDMRTEFLIQEALQNLMKGRTTFVIAQRLRTVQLADQIIVMRDGAIVERGKHSELLQGGGLYRQIYDLELRDQEEAHAAVAGKTGDA